MSSHAEVHAIVTTMKPSAGHCASGAAGPSSGEAEAEGASATSGSGRGKSGTTEEGATSPRGGKLSTDKVMRSALRVLKLRLDRVGRKLSELDFDNRALTGRVQFFRSENGKLHQALEKERAKARNSPDRLSAGSPAGTSQGGACAQGGATSGSPTNASFSAAALLDGERGPPSGANVNAVSSTGIEQGPWPLSPSGPGRSCLLADMMTPSTSSASLDAILSPRRQLRNLQQEPQEQLAVIALASTAATPISPPRLALPPPIPPALPVFTFGQPQRSNTSFQDVSEDPIFLFTDLFEDTSDESVNNNNLGISRQGPGLVSSSVTVQNAASTDTVPSTSTAAKRFSSNTTVASDVASTSRDQQLDQQETQDQHDQQDQRDLQEQHDRKEQLDQQEPHDQQQPLQDQQVSSTTSDPNSESKGTRSRSPLHDEPDLYEPKYSMSSSSLD